MNHPPEEGRCGPSPTGSLKISHPSPEGHGPSWNLAPCYPLILSPHRSSTHDPCPQRVQDLNSPGGQALTVGFQPSAAATLCACGGRVGRVCQRQSPWVHHSFGTPRTMCQQRQLPRLRTRFHCPAGEQRPEKRCCWGHRGKQRPLAPEPNLAPRSGDG